MARQATSRQPPFTNRGLVAPVAQAEGRTARSNWRDRMEKQNLSGEQNSRVTKVAVLRERLGGTLRLSSTNPGHSPSSVTQRPSDRRPASTENTVPALASYQCYCEHTCTRASPRLVCTGSSKKPRTSAEAHAGPPNGGITVYPFLDMRAPPLPPGQSGRRCRTRLAQR